MKLLEVNKDFFIALFIILLKVIGRVISDDLLEKC